MLDVMNDIACLAKDLMLAGHAFIIDRSAVCKSHVGACNRNDSNLTHPPGALDASFRCDLPRMTKFQR